jgi:tRNA G37 N-methylase Trm5
MNASMVLKSDKAFTPPTILYSALDRPVVHHRENGTSFKIDFSLDSFSSVLVSPRSKIRSLLRDSEYVCEIAQGVDCLSIALGNDARVAHVDIVVVNQGRHPMIHESMGLNQAKKYTLISSVEDVMPKPSAIYDRLIISDPSFVVTEGVKKRLVKPGGIVHQIEWRNTKFMMVQSTFTPGN